MNFLGFLGLMFFLAIVVTCLCLYFLLYRPHKKNKKEIDVPSNFIVKNYFTN